MNATFERIASAIYEKMRAHDSEGQKYPWVPGGNSHKQKEAREYARAALGAMHDPGDAVLTEVCAYGVCAGDVPAAWNAGIDEILKANP